VLQRRFGYCFEQDGFYNAIYRHHLIEGPFQAAGIAVTPFVQDHGSIPSVGFRFGRFAYANDVVALADDAFKAMAGVEALVIDAMRYRPHPTHAHLDLALQWIERISPQRAFLTNLHVDMDYAELDRRTPNYVRPCHDGLVIDVDGE
jgi:phosphoribosyl 1,2-cyclic phosphate phosphodiesterase